MVTFVQYGKTASADTDDNPSPSIWSDVPDLAALHDPSLGFGMYDDFVGGFTTAVNGWLITAITSGNARGIAGLGGVARFDTAAATADAGMQAQYVGSGTSITTAVAPFFPLAGTKIYFECRLGIGDTPSGCQLFAGLSEVDATLFATGDNTSANHLGFEMNQATQAGTVGTAGTANFFGEKAGTRNTASADVGLDVHLFTDGGTAQDTLFTTASTFVKLGFIVDGIDTCTVYVNGQLTNDVIVTANIPILGLTPTLLLHGEGGSVDPSMQITFVKCFQTRAS